MRSKVYCHSAPLSRIEADARALFFRGGSESGRGSVAATLVSRRCKTAAHLPQVRRLLGNHFPTPLLPPWAQDLAPSPPS